MIDEYFGKTVSEDKEKISAERIAKNKAAVLSLIEKEDGKMTRKKLRAHLKTPSKQEHKRHGTKKAIFIPKRSKYRLK